MLTNGLGRSENNDLDRIAIIHDREAERRKHRISLVPFDEIILGTEARYLVKGIIPGLASSWLGDRRNVENRFGYSI